MSDSLAWSDRINLYRVFPRIFSIFYLLITYEVTAWFMMLESPSNAQAGMVSIVVGAAAAFFRFYVDSGNPKQ